MAAKQKVGRAAGGGERGRWGRRGGSAGWLRAPAAALRALQRGWGDCDACGRRTQGGPGGGAAGRWRVMGATATRATHLFFPMAGSRPQLGRQCSRPWQQRPARGDDRWRSAGYLPQASSSGVQFRCEDHSYKEGGGQRHCGRSVEFGSTAWPWTAGALQAGLSAAGCQRLLPGTVPQSSAPELRASRRVAGS